MDCVIDLPKIIDERGNLSFVEGGVHVPFGIARCYWIYDVPGGEFRGSHAFREQDEFIVALSGSFDVVLDDGDEVRRYGLNRSYMGVYVPRMTWRRIENFSTNSLCLVLSSRRYDAADYIWDYGSFLLERGLERVVHGEDRLCGMLADGLGSSVYNCNVAELPKVHDRAGNLTALNGGVEVPFGVERCYWIYDVPGGAARGGHAHKELRQLLVAASGSFDVILDDGIVKRSITLNRPYIGVLIVPGIWRELTNFSSGAVCLVLTSDRYDEGDYIRDYDDFLMYKGCR